MEKDEIFLPPCSGRDSDGDFDREREETGNDIAKEDRHIFPRHPSKEIWKKTQK